MIRLFKKTEPLHFRGDRAVPDDLFIRQGYESRARPAFFSDDLVNDGLVHQPDVYEFTAYLAGRFEARTVIDLGCGAGHKLRALRPRFRTVGVDLRSAVRRARREGGGGRWIAQDLSRPMRLRLDDEDKEAAIVVCSDVIEHLPDPRPLLTNLAELSDSGSPLVISTPERDLVRGADHLGPPPNPHHVREWNLPEFSALLSRAGIPPTFLGLTANNSRDRAKRTILAVVDPANAATPPTPRNFDVLAIVAAYNELDVLPETVDRLIAAGIRVHVIDNWSDDGTYEALAARLGTAFSIERFPADGPTGTYQWRSLLQRVEVIAAQSGADWVVHHDADELRESPRRGIGLRDGIFEAHARGFNAIDHTVIDFRPVVGPCSDGLIFDAMRYFEFGSRPGHFLQIKAWRNLGRVDLAGSGGHEARFSGRRVYPYKFLLRHYPIRSVGHAERKIWRDRRPRWDGDERAMGWHIQYDGIEHAADVERRREDLIHFDDSFYERFLVERLSGVGVSHLTASRAL